MVNHLKVLAVVIAASSISLAATHSAHAQPAPEKDTPTGQDVYKPTAPSAPAPDGKPPTDAGAEKLEQMPESEHIKGRTDPPTAPGGQPPSPADAEKLEKMPESDYIKPQDRQSQ